MSRSYLQVAGRCARIVPATLLTVLLLTLAALANSPILSVLDLRPAGTNNTWRIRWNSVPGADYQLQRTSDDQLRSTNNQWVPVLSVRATNSVTTVNDAGGTGPRQRFYRVVQLARELSLRIIDLRQVGATNVWRLRWNSIPGLDYQVQRAKDDQLDSVLTNGWVPVLSVRASGDVTSAEDTAGNLVRQRFYRVVQLTNEQSLVVSTVDSGAGGGGGSGGGAPLRIITGGTQTVSSVVFFDNGNVLGDGAPGLGGAWEFNLPPNPGGVPRIRRISARVTTAEGTVVDTQVSAFLEADPAKFVPVNDDGSRAYGRFVSADASGALARFLYFPESLGDAARITGAHFDFAAGATLKNLVGSVGIEFVSAKFFRGHRDDSPLNFTGAPRTLDFEGISPADVRAAMALPPGETLALLWNGLPLAWLDGAFADAGWSTLKVRPPFGELPLPLDLECATVTFDTRTGDPTLVLCFHGDWTPFGPSPAFRIPRAEPLKIYLSWNGSIAAHGTVEATFADGATVRGSVSWREPNFEVRFQGRNIVIPALASLKRALPANPEQCIPAGNTVAELDAAAKCLTSFRDTYRALAMGGAAESSLDGTQSFAPLPEPTDSVGTALAGWASRLASWTADRAGQLLDAQQITDLAGVLENAAKTGEAAHDPPTVLKLLRDVLVVSRHAAPALGGSSAANDLLAKLPTHRVRLLAAGNRIIGELPVSAPGTDIAQSVRLLAEIRALAGISAAGAGAPLLVAAQGNPPAPGEFESLGELLLTKASPSIFTDRGIEEGHFDGPGNGLLESHSLEELIEFLDQVQVVFDELVGLGRINRLDHPLSPYPLDEAVAQTLFWLGVRHQEVCDQAVAKKDARLLVVALRQRLQIFDRLASLRTPIPPEGEVFLPTIAEMALALEEPFARQLLQVSSEDRLKLLEPLTKMLNRLSEHVQDLALGDYLEGTWLQLSDANSVILAALTADCEALENELRTAEGSRYRLKRLPLGDEGLRALPITGKYESVSGTTTLQINQAGRYIAGYIEWHSPNGRSARDRLEGLLTKDRNDSVEFAFVRRRTAGNLFYGRLAGTLVGQRVQLILRPDTAGTGPPETFIQTTIVPVLGEAVIDSYPDKVRPLVSSVQRYPLHSRQIGRVLETFPEARDAIHGFVAAGSDSAAQLPFVSRINTVFRQLKRQVLSLDQLPQVRLLFEQSLSKFRPLGSTRTYWENILVMFASHGNQMPDLQTMLGGTPAQIGNSGEMYTYDITISGAGPGISAGVFDLGLAAFRLHIQKTSTTGATDSFDLTGGVGQGGIGPELGFNFAELDASTNVTEFLGSIANFASEQYELPLSILNIAEHQVIQSPINYRKEDLAGPVMGISGEAGIALELPTPFGTGELKLFNVEASGLALMGSGNLPPLVLSSPPEPEGPGAELATNKVNFSGGFAAEITATVGYVWDEGEALELLSRPLPVRFRPSQDVAFDSALFFETDADTISSCGWQFLRRLVGEHAGIFLSPAARVRVLGMTDTRQSDTYNAGLSQRRANNVKANLLTILGPMLAIQPEDILAIGLGELAGKDGINPTTIPAFTHPRAGGRPPLGTAEPWLVKFIADRRQLLGTIADEIDSPQWRSVVVLLNNTVVMELTEPEEAP